MLRRSIPCCPHCGAPLDALLERRKIGAALPPLKQHMFDTIRTAGEIGITSRDLLAVVYDRQARRRPKHLAIIRNHIFQINELLLDTDWKIVTHDRRHWIAIRRPRF